MDAYKIRSMLQEQAEAVVQYLLPHGKRQGQSWVVGSVRGEEGNSLKVCISGPKRGVWMDGAESLQGGILDLWMACRGVTFRQALEESAKWLNLSDQSTERESIKIYKKPSHDAKPIGLGSPVKEYLTRDRKLSPSIIKALKIGEKESSIVFNYYSPDGELTMSKYLALERDERGRKKIFISPGCKPILYGMDTALVKSSPGILLICEGEIDCATWQQWGVPATSVPFGAKKDSSDGTSPNDEWITNCWAWLQGFHTIYLSMDMEDDGDEAAESILKRLGREKCFIISLPYKDANECLKNGITSGQPFLESAKIKDPDDIKTGRQLSSEVWDYIRNGEEELTGVQPFGWKDFDFRIRMGESTIISGDPNIGKSTFAYAVLGWLAAVKGEGCFIGSYESSAATILGKMVRQIAGKQLQINDYKEYAMIREAVMDKVVVHRYEGRASWKVFLERASYAVRRYGVKHVLLDSITCTDANLNDREKVDELMGGLQGFWKAHDVHLWAIAHARKGNDPERPPESRDILGSVVQWALIDNVLIPYRYRGETCIKVDKQRLGGSKPPMKVFFDKQSLRLKEAPDELIQPWVDLPQPAQANTGDPF